MISKIPAAVLVACAGATVALRLPLSAPYAAAGASALVLLAASLLGALSTRAGAFRSRWRLRRALRPLRGSPTYGAAVGPGRSSWVYLIGAADGRGLVKIGTTVDVKARLATLQCGSPVRLTVLWLTPGDRALEAGLHRQYAALRAHGEWFALRPADVHRIRGALS